MRFKYFAIIFLAASMMWGCQQNSDQTNDGEQAPGQTQPAPGTFQQQPQATTVSDEELKQFVAVAEHMQIIGQEAQQIMVNSIQQIGLDLNRFNEIQQAQINPEQEVNATGEEMEKYEAATRELEKIQVEAQQKMQEKIQEEGLTETRYQEISMTLQNDPQLQEKFRNIQQQTE